MRILLIVVGRPRDASLAAAAQDYERRSSHYWPLEVVEVKEEPAKARTPEFVRSREGERLLAQVPAGAMLAACTEGGRSLDSSRFADLLRDARDRARDVAFIIGGAFGLAPEVLATATMKLSLGPWTLPHELARVVLSEQIYRAGTIVRGEPYHK